MALMTRGEFAVRLAQDLGLDMSAASSGFSDTAGTGYDAAIAALKAAGIVTGTSSSTFNPNAVITREQVATMLGRAYGLTGGSTSFGDVATTSYAYSYIAGLEAAGVFYGTSTGVFGYGQGFDDKYYDEVMGRLSGFTPITGTGGQTKVNLPIMNKPPSTSSVVQPGSTPVDDSQIPAEDAEPVLDQNAFAYVTNIIENTYGLSGMGALVEQWMIGGMGPDEVLLAIRDTDQFNKRFPVIQARQKAGLAPVSVDEVLAYERAVRGILRAAGMPAGFYNSYSKIQDLMLADMSPVEIQTRMSLAFDRVAGAPLEVRQMYANWFGPKGDSALASYFLDPNTSVYELERSIATAEVGGMADRFGFNLGQTRSSELAALGVDMARAFSGFERLAGLAPVFQETVGETGTDLTALGTGVGAEFEGDVGAARQIERRVGTRVSRSSGGGAAALTPEGVIGLRSAT